MQYTKTNRDTYYNFYGDDWTDELKEQCIAYAKMAKQFLNKPMNSPRDIVGNYEWHQEYPYENWLLQHIPQSAYTTETGDKRVGTKAIDFGVGVGRMIPRIGKFYDQVDGTDVSGYALAMAKELNPNSTFYESSGLDIGDVPDYTYDLFYSTIAMQHIPVRTIRKNMFRGIYNALKDGGWMSFQLAFNPDAKAGRWSHDTEHAEYEADFIGANATNGHADVIINMSDLGKLSEDIKDVFGNTPFIEADNVASKYQNLNGQYHAPYWASHWLYVSVKKG